MFFAADSFHCDREVFTAITSLINLEPATLLLSHGGNWKPYKLALPIPPEGQVVINITTDDPTVQIGPSQLTFTPENWNVPQQVNVRAVTGGANPETRAATISHTLATADPLINNAVITMPAQIRNWRFAYLPTVME